MKELRLEALRNDPGAFGSTYEGTLQRPDNWWKERLEAAELDPSRTMLFAEEEGRLVGMAGAYPEEDLQNVDIVSMYVSPAFRRRGIARELLDRVIAKQEGNVCLCVNQDQVAARKLYESYGFVTIAETNLTRPDGSEYVQLYMRLPK
jgi:ribosomal protein S18 acetylase RimI-like enzyme